MAQESVPLLRTRTDSYASTQSDCQSRFTLESRAVRQFFRRRFWWFCVLGVAAIIVLQLSFLPRTSLNRDFRRWHDLHLAKTDVKRIYLVELCVGRADPDGLTIEQHVDTHLVNLTTLSRKLSSGLASSDAPLLTSYVEKSMRSLGFRTRTYTYPLLPLLQLPRSLSLHLVDSKSGRKLYTAPMEEPSGRTPAFFPFGSNGTVKAQFIYANNGLPADYDLLLKNSISPQGKIVIFSHSLASEYSLAQKIAYVESLGCAAVVVQGDQDLDTSVSRNFKPETVPESRFRVPISYNLAVPILAAMGMPSSDFSKWKWLPYCVDNSLLLELTSEFAPSPLNATNVVAEIDGVINDGEIVVGAARDVLTSLNPQSGHAVMLEVMRRFQNLRKVGWRPLRRIRFVSWDAARSGALGAFASSEDPAMFQSNLPILAYINLDDDLVTGSHFTVDANPLFNHLVAKTAKLIPFSRNSTYFKRLQKENELHEHEEWARNSINSMYEADEGDGDEEDDDDEDDGAMTSLYHYWRLQSNATINNSLGGIVAGKATSMFQLQKAAPVINLKFQQSPNHNDSAFAPESNFYNYKWLTTEVDKNLEFHGLLVRFVGLFVLSLEEHEVIDSRAHVYFKKVRSFFRNFENDNQDKLSAWRETQVLDSLHAKSALLNDLKALVKDTDYNVTIGAVLNQTNTLLGRLVKQAVIFDEYNKEVEDLLTRDYPWYKMLKKVHIYAKFKVANYKSLRIEKELTLQEDDASADFHHFMYDVPRGFLTNNQKLEQGAFGALYEAVAEDRMKHLVKLIDLRYEVLKSVLRKMT